MSLNPRYGGALRIPKWGRALVIFATLTLGSWGLLPAAMRAFPPPECVSTCGMKSYGTRDCEGLNAAENRALNAFEHYVHGWPRWRTCETLHGVVLGVTHSVIGRSSNGHRVIGRMYSPTATLLVEDDNWATNAYAHELAHWFEYSVDQFQPGVDHGTWDFRHVWDALAASIR